MRHSNKTSIVLLQLAAFAFFLNAVAAYGTCAMPVPDSNSAGIEQMPCHTAEHAAADKSETEPSVDDCCSTCVLVALSIDVSFSTYPEPGAFHAQILPSRVSGGFDPPFRPPNLVLS